MATKKAPGGLIQDLIHRANPSPNVQPQSSARFSFTHTNRQSRRTTRTAGKKNRPYFRRDAAARQQNLKGDKGSSTESSPEPSMSPYYASYSGQSNTENNKLDNRNVSDPYYHANPSYNDSHSYESAYKDFAEPNSDYDENGSYGDYENSDDWEAYNDFQDYHHDSNQYEHHGMDDDFWWWDHCAAPQNPDRTVTLAADYSGDPENFMYVDSTFGLAKFGLGATDEDVAHSKKAAIAHFRNHFGLDVNLSKFSMHPDGFMFSEETGMSFAPVVFNVTFRVVADSWYSTSCADVRALLGGWVLAADNVTVHGTLGGEHGIFYKGHSIFANLFLVGAPGTQDSTRTEIMPVYPLNCGRDGSCVISGMSYNFENNALGWVDGSSVSYHVPGYDYQQVIRLVAMWPGRFFPMPGMNEFLSLEEEY